MSIGGAIFVAKQKPGLQDDVTYEVHTHEERVTIDRFAALDRRLRFAPNRLTVETFDGEIVEVRENPRDAFKGKQRNWPGTRSTSATSAAMRCCGPN
jgi:hypothetical protein